MIRHLYWNFFAVFRSIDESDGSASVPKGFWNWMADSVTGVTLTIGDIRLVEKPQLRDPVLLEGLPGIGLVANIAVAYLIRKLKAKFLGAIHSSSFPDISITNKGGSLKYPFCHLYYHRGDGGAERDLVLLYGNTQALTRRGQYELCGSILDSMELVGCKYIITLGGYRPGKPVMKPNLYYAASDLETAQIPAKLGAEILAPQIFGVAGLLVGLAALRGMKGFCLLAETLGTHRDKVAARAVLEAISRELGPRLDIGDLEEYEELADFLVPFDFGALADKQRKKEVKPKWFI